MLQTALLLAAALALSVSASVRTALLELLGIGSRVHGPATAGARVNWPLVSVLIASLLLVTTLPEARVFLMFLDAVGLDFFLLLLTLQGRAYGGLLWAHVLVPTWRQLKAFGPFPLDFPTLRVMRDFPFQSTCAVAGIAVSVTVLIGLALIIAAPVTALVEVSRTL